MFYQALKVRHTQNMIREIQGPNGETYKQQNEIKKEAERHFTTFLGYTPPDYEGLAVGEMERLIDFRCAEAEKEKLMKEVSEEDVKNVLFAMAKDKSPGPDGYTTEFYKSVWHIIGKDFTIAIQSFFIMGFLPKMINSTILPLIPKRKEEKEMKDYRPISCCNVIYKVISKLLANRLKSILPEMIAPNQTAFIKDRLLMENLRLAT